MIRIRWFAALALCAPLATLLITRDASTASDAGTNTSDGGALRGRLPPTVIQQIVRSNFGRFTSCYSTGLRTNRNLKGCVITRFLIDRDGGVASSADVTPADVAIPNPSVRKCVVDEFAKLTFPAPEGGVVTVQYPLEFQPSQSDQHLCRSASPRDAGTD